MLLLSSLAETKARDTVSVRIGDGALSRDALRAAAAAVAAEIAGAPIVAVYAEPSLTTVVAVAGCLLAGVPVVPVPPDCGPIERAHVLADSGAALVLGGHPWDDVALPVVPVDPHSAAPSTTSAPPPSPDATAFVMYTSGTTGLPKGVLLSHRAIAHDLDALTEAWAWTAEDVLVHGLPLFHVHGLILGLIGSLRVGNQFVHTVRPTPEAYAAAAERGGTLLFGVPTVWSRVVAAPDKARALIRARLIVSGSAALPTPVFDKLRTLAGHTPLERYGMTETLITLSTRHDSDRLPGRVGLPLRGVETRLGDDLGAPLLGPDPETMGELQVRGPTLFGGYQGNAEATAASFTSDGWFRTGDAATIDENGQHRIVGRLSSDILKTGGYRVGAAEVESALLSHPSVSEAAVVGVPDDDLGQRIVAFVVAPDLRDADLSAFVAGQLSHHKRPRRIHVVESLPRNAMGKVLKAELTRDA